LRDAIPAKVLASLLPIGLNGLRRPPSGEAAIAEGRSDERFYDIAWGGSQFGMPIRVGVGDEVERLVSLSVVYREIARLNVEFADRLAVDGHLEPVGTTDLLVAGLDLLAVEPTTKVPIESRIVAAVEYPNEAPMRAAANFEPVDEFVQVDDCLLHRQQFLGVVELHLLAGSLVPVRRMARMALEAQWVFREVGDEVLADVKQRHAVCGRHLYKPRCRPEAGGRSALCIVVKNS